jgi:hypothetical protein
MKAWFVSLGLAAFCCCSAAFAQDATATVDPAKVAVATKILEETHTLDNMNVALDTMIGPLIKIVKQQAPNLSDEQLKMITDMLLEEMRSGLPKMLALNAQIYASHFTLDELEAVESFYETPAGKKVIAETPNIVKEVIPLGMAWGRQAAQQALEHVTEKLRKQGVKI